MKTLVKIASNALSKRTKLVRENLGPESDRWHVKLKDKIIGSMHVVGGQVRGSKVDKKFRGMGVGKKMYGEVMRRQSDATLSSDSSLTDAAKGLWKRMDKKKGYLKHEPEPGSYRQPQFTRSLPTKARKRPQGAGAEWDTFANLHDKMQEIRKTKK